MADLPTGTVTFLFTDIEGSTRLARRDPEQWERARAQHHAILQEKFEAHGGYVFQIVGDAFCAAFPNVFAAANAALAAQRALAQIAWGYTPIRVRMGIHTGTAESRDGAYQGYLTLAHVQRVMALASGGQILVSSTSAQLLREDAANRAAESPLRDLGTFRLKDFATAEHIFQLDAADLPSHFPPLQTGSATLNNLPIQLTSFIGRTHELAELQSLLKSTRLLTLTGVGGTGKTRLSLAVAEVMRDEYADGVWFVELASLSDPALVPQTVAAALDLHAEAGHTVGVTLLSHLREKRALLIFDNCEHLLDSSARLADAILRAAPRVQILASSREALGIAGETTYHVSSLATPDPENLPPEAALRELDAVRLFVERAQAAKPSFALTAQNAPAIAQVCYRLDGIPLAIELAAARIRAFSPEQLASRLDDRFRLLTGGSRTALPRQQTLRSTIDWSYGLLSEPEHVLLRRLSVFVGGWSLEGAEAVIQDAGGQLQDEGSAVQPSSPIVHSQRSTEADRQTGFIIQPSDVLDLLSHLVEKSLVMHDDQSSEPRYRMLETIRQYALEKLVEANEAHTARNAHLAYFMRLHEEALPALRGSEQSIMFRRLAAEHGNLRAAAEWGLQSQQALLTLRLASVGAPYFWYISGYENEWMERLLKGLARPEAAERTAIRARALTLAGGVYAEIGDYARAPKLLAEALAIGRELDLKDIVAEVLMFSANVRNGQGDLMQAQRLMTESLTLIREVGEPWQEAIILMNLADTYLYEGNVTRARELYQASADLFQSIGADEGPDYPIRRLAQLALMEGKPAQAAECALLILDVNQQRGHKPVVLASLSLLAAVAAHRGQSEQAVRLFALVEALREAWQTHIGRLADRIDYDRNLAAVRGKLPSQSFEALWAEGRSLVQRLGAASALEQAATEGRAIADNVMQDETSETSPARSDFQTARLTTRELEVLRLLVQGLSDAQIAETLVVSTRTVNSHLRAIYSKLDVSSRTAAVHAARERRLA